MSQTQLRTTSVQLGRNAAKGRRVCGIVGVKQIQFHLAHLDLPDSDPQLEAGESGSQPQPFAVCLAHRPNRKLPRIIEWVQSLLVALCIDLLPEIALLIEQTNANHRHTQVACCFKLIPGDVAEPARINRQRFTQHELHREIGNCRYARMWMRRLEPCFRLFDERLLPAEINEESLKSRVGSNSLQFFTGYRLQQNPGIVGQIPEFVIELLPKLVCRVIERPPEVQGQLGKSI